MEMVDSVDDLKEPRDQSGRKDFPNIELLDAKSASAFEQDHPEFPLLDRFLRGRQIAYMIYDYFRVTGAHDTRS